MLIFWVILVVAFVVLEIVTVGLTSIWFAGGAVVALILCAGGVGVPLQIIVFCAVSLVLLIFTRPWAMKYLKPHLTKTNYEGNVGQLACLTERVDNLHGTGTALLNGQEWTARAYDPARVFEAGTTVRVREIRGVTLYVEEDI